MALQKLRDFSAGVCLGLLGVAVMALAGCHQGQGPAEASSAVTFAKEFANTNGVENPEVIKTKFGSGTWYVSLRSKSGAIAVVQVSTNGELLSYHFHE